MHLNENGEVDFSADTQLGEGAAAARVGWLNDSKWGGLLAFIRSLDKKGELAPYVLEADKVIASFEKPDPILYRRRVVGGELVLKRTSQEGAIEFTLNGKNLFESENYISHSFSPNLDSLGVFLNENGLVSFKDINLATGKQVAFTLKKGDEIYQSSFNGGAWYFCGREAGKIRFSKFDPVSGLRESVEPPLPLRVEGGLESKGQAKDLFFLEGPLLSLRREGDMWSSPQSFLWDANAGKFSDKPILDFPKGKHTEITMGDDGNYYVLDHRSSQIYRISPEGFAGKTFRDPQDFVRAANCSWPIPQGIDSPKSDPSIYFWGGYIVLQGKRPGSGASIVMLINNQGELVKTLERADLVDMHKSIDPESGKMATTLKIQSRHPLRGIPERKVYAHPEDVLSAPNTELLKDEGALDGLKYRRAHVPSMELQIPIMILGPEGSVESRETMVYMYGGFGHRGLTPASIPSEVLLFAKSGRHAVVVNLPGDHGWDSGGEWFQEGRGAKGRTNNPKHLNNVRNWLLDNGYASSASEVVFTGKSHGAFTTLEAWSHPSNVGSPGVALNPWSEMMASISANLQPWLDTLGLDKLDAAMLERLSIRAHIAKITVEEAGSFAPILLLSSPGDNRTPLLEAMIPLLLGLMKGLPMHLVLDSKDHNHSDAATFLAEPYRDRLALLLYILHLSQKQKEEKTPEVQLSE